MRAGLCAVSSAAVGGNYSIKQALTFVSRFAFNVHYLVGFSE